MSFDRRRLDLTDLPNQVEVIVAKTQLLSKEGWSESRLVAYAKDVLSRHWTQLASPGPNQIDEILADAGLKRDWHRLRVHHFKDFEAYRKPEQRPDVPMPPGTNEALMAQWAEREDGWTKEWRLSELIVEKYSTEYGVHVR